MMIATYINYYHICKRKLWLFANEIRMEHTSERVAEGKLIEKTSYLQRSDKYTELEINGSKIDFYDARNKVIHEIKKSDKMETAHEWQLKYYIWLLLQDGITAVKGILEYPKLRQTKEVILTEHDIQLLQQDVINIQELIHSPTCPLRTKKGICKHCAYYDFCWIDE
jgi:CRISPR-associated exonuclease Cas4